MEDILTSGEVVQSVKGGLAKFVRLYLDPSDLAAYVRRSLGRGDYLQSIRDGDTPAWERAFAMVVSVQDLHRAFAGRTRDGTLRRASIDDIREPGPVRPTACIVQTAPPAPPPKARAPREEDPARWLAESAGESGYTYDPSWTNGGLSAAGADHDTDAAKDARIARGIDAFRSVEGFGGIPELAWYHSAAAFELGISSNFDGLVAALVNGGKHSGSNGSPPTGPSEDMTAAAALQRRVMLCLGELPWSLQVVLELAYADRRYPNQLVSQYGLGVAPLVWRAQRVAGEAHIGPATVDALQDMLGAYRWDPDGPVKTRAKASAERLLLVAHDAYRGVAGIEPPRPRGPRRRRRSLRECASDGCREFRAVEAPSEAA